MANARASTNRTFPAPPASTGTSDVPPSSAAVTGGGGGGAAEVAGGGGGGGTAEVVSWSSINRYPWAVRSFSFAPVYFRSDYPTNRTGGHENDLTAHGHLLLDFQTAFGSQA